MIDDEQASPGHEWALGFLTGVDLSRESWLAFLEDEERAGPLLPIFMLAHEHDPDPELRTPSLTPEKREEVLAHVSAGITMMHRHFLARRRGAGIAAPGISRNAPCPCGSGRSYKRCCGRSR